MSTNILLKQNEKNRMLQEGHTISPAVNVSELEKEFLIEIEMVDLKKENIDVQFSGKELTIRGKRQNDIQKKYAPLLLEREPYEYFRTFMIDYEIQKDKIDAKYENGVLTLKLLKGEKALPKKIKIN